jgi:hypothetical protein
MKCPICPLPELIKEERMSLYVSKRTYAPATEGLHQAACVDVKDLGKVDGQFGPKEMVEITFELDEIRDDGQRFIVKKRYTKSLHDKSSLHKDLRSWRGVPFTADELRQFNLERLVGAPCQMLITHVEKDGTVYGNISAIMKAEKSKTYIPSGQYVRTNNGVSNDHDTADYNDSVPEDEEPSF